MGGGVVGTDVHAYDVPRRHAYQPSPSLRPAQDPSATPIYDALYAEWVKSYRALPGDRHGEEELGFQAFFANSPHSTGSYGAYQSGTYTGRHSAAAHATGHFAPPHGTRQDTQQGSSAPVPSVWQPIGRMPTGHTGMHHIPAALPPGPRRGM